MEDHENQRSRRPSRGEREDSQVLRVHRGVPEPAAHLIRLPGLRRDLPCRLTFIRTAQRLGITLHEVKEILSIRDRGETPCTYVREVLDTQLGTIEQRIRELAELKADLLELVAEADQLPPENCRGTCQLIDHAQKKANPARGT